MTIQKNIYDKLIDVVLKNNIEFKILYNIRNVNTTTDTIIIGKGKIEENNEMYGKYVNNEYIMIELPKRNYIIYDSDVEENMGESMGTSLHVFCYKRGICSLAGDIGTSNENLLSIFDIIDSFNDCKANEYHPHYDVDKYGYFTESHNFKPHFMNNESQELIKKFGEVRIHFTCKNKSFDEMYEIIKILSKY